MSADLLFKTMTAIENLFAAPDAKAEQEAEEQLLAVRYEIHKHLVNITLDQMAANAKELGLTYDAPVAQIDTSPERVEKEAGNKDVRPPNCGTGFCSCVECLFEQPAPPECKTEAEKTAFAFGWFKALESVREQPAPAQEPVACVHIKDGCLVGSHRDQSNPFPDGQYGLWPIDTTPPAPAQPLTDNRMKVKLGSQYGADLEGHWFYLRPADEFAEAALVQRTGITKGTP